MAINAKAREYSNYGLAVQLGASQESPDVEFASDAKIEFRDTGLYIYSSADGVLDIVSDTTIAMSGAVTMSSTLAMSGAITMGTTTKVQFRDTGLYINSGADGKLTISADGSGTDDITISGTVTLDDDLITPTTKKVQFRDSGLYINSAADGKLTISADGTGTDDINLAGTVSGDADWVTTGKTTSKGSFLSVTSITGSDTLATDVSYVALNSATAAIAVTLGAPAAGRYLVITQTDTGTAQHSVTLNGTGAATYDGTNYIAKFNAKNETLVLVGLDTARYAIVVNVGAVSMSTT